MTDNIVNCIKEVLSSHSIHDYTSFDPTFIEYFVSNIENNSESNEDLLDMLIALCPELLNKTEEIRLQILNEMIIFIKNTDTKSLSTSSIDLPQHSQLTNKSEREINTLNAQIKLIELEISLIITDLKLYFQSNNITSSSSTFENANMRNLLEMVVSQSDNAEFLSDIVSQYFTITTRDSRVINGIIKLLKSRKTLNSYLIDSMNQSNTSTTMSSDSTHNSDLLELYTLYPTIKEDLIQYVFLHICANNKVFTITKLSDCLNNPEALDTMTTLKQTYDEKIQYKKQTEYNTQQRIKANIAKQYSEEKEIIIYKNADTNTSKKKGGASSALTPRAQAQVLSSVQVGGGGGSQKVRYRDGEIVTYTGEKVSHCYMLYLYAVWYSRVYRVCDHIV